MEKTISAADANRSFSRILREVREGQRYVVTSHGRPVARIVPADSEHGSTRTARSSLLARLEAQPAVDVGPWRRDDLYERDR